MKEVIVGSKGMVKDLEITSPEQYTHALNVLMESFDGNSFTPSNDYANIFGASFLEGENILHKRFIPELDKIILFTTKNRILELSGDFNDFDYNRFNSEEGSEPLPLPTASSLSIKVLAESECFNWKIINKVISEYKITDSTLNIYFVDGDNEDRYIYFNMDGSVEDSFKQIISTSPLVYSNKIDCNSLKWYPNISYPEIKTEDVEGGQLKAGVYQFSVAWSTSKGIPLTDYKATSNPFHLFTKPLTDVTDYDTGKAIVITLNNLNETGRYRFINIGVTKTINGVTSSEMIATLPVNSEIKYTYTGNKQGTPLEELTMFQLYTFYRSSKGITKANNRIFKYGLKEFPKYNLQPLMSKLVTKWVTIAATEGDYRKPEFAQNYKSVIRDEVYPYGIEFILKNGEVTPVFALIGRDKNDEDKELIAEDNKDNFTTEDICKEVELKERWEVYNTAKVTKTNTEVVDPCKYQEYQEGEFAYWESTDKYPDDKNVWGELANTPIRHFKFPDCLVSPIHNGTSITKIQYDTKNTIYPIGIKVEGVAEMLQEAVNTKLITQEQKDNISGYRIVRGNRFNNKSVIAKGILNTVWNYIENSKVVFYPNYGFNDLRVDPFLSSQDLKIASTNIGERKNTSAEYLPANKYTFNSPDTSFTQPTIGTILKVENEIFGESKGFFNQSEGHGEYVILSQRHYNFAIIIAYLMTCRLELSKSSPATQGQSIGSGIGAVAGGVIGAFAGGVGAPLGAALGSALGGIIGKLVGGNTADDDYNAVYRLSMWISQTDRILELLQNTIPMQNYHWQYQAVGKYRNTEKVENNGFKQRRIKYSDYLNPTRQIVSENLRFNNYLRESSVYLDLEEDIARPKNIDNSKHDGCEDENVEVTTSTSNFYTAIKREISNQYGNIFSIDWLPTSNKMFSVGETAQVFGGDTFIGGFAYKKNHNFFTQTAYRLPDNTDTYYEDYPNMGYPLYFFNTKYTELSAPDNVDLKFLNSIENSWPLVEALNNIDSPQAVTRPKEWATRGVQDAIGSLFQRSVMNPYTLIRPGRYTINCEEDSFVNYLRDDNNLIELPSSAGWLKDLVPFSETGVSKYVYNMRFDFSGVKGRIYTYNYAIPYFICESDVNLDLRHATNPEEGEFYPHVLDIRRWLQPEGDYQPNRLDNTYNYNRTYSKQNSEGVRLQNDINFFKNKDKISHENRVIYSQSGAEVENVDFRDNYLYFKPLDSFDFTFENGKLTSVDGIEGEQVLVRFENNMRIFNAFDTLRSDNTSIIIGNGSLFGSRPQEFSKTDLGYLGSQHTDLLATPFGHIFVDAKRGNVFNLKSGGKSVDELTKNGMRNWFFENLPFNIRKYFDVDIDNTFNDVGITMCYDNRFKRILITKLDYIPKVKGIVYKDNVFSYNGTPIKLTDGSYFCNASWTVSYSFYTESWTSFHSFLPHYYIEGVETFFTGLNGNGRGLSSIWTHNKTNKLFQTYYGILRPFEIETTSKYSFTPNILTDVAFKLDVIRYHNDKDYSYVDDVAFNKAIIYNDKQNSGLLQLDIVDKEDLFKRRQYPIKEYNQTKITLQKNETEFNFNEFADIAEDNNLPRFINACNNVDKSLNLKAINYQSFKVDNNYIRGDRNNIKLINDKHSYYKFIFKGIINNNTPSVR